MELTENNISTIATMVFPFFAYVFAKYFSITIDQTMFVLGFTAVIEFILLIWSAKNPNTLAIFGNQKQQANTDETVLNEEYIYGDDDGC